MNLVEDISQITVGRRYALIVSGQKIRELTGGSFQDRKAELVIVWIRARILYDITEEDYSEPKIKSRK